MASNAKPLTAHLPYFDKASLLCYNFLTMTQMATITSKRQLTIPVDVFKRLNFKEGQKVLISDDNGAMVVSPMMKLVNELAGSVKLPARFKGMPIDEVIEKAKKEYFNRP